MFREPLALAPGLPRAVCGASFNMWALLAWCFKESGDWKRYSNSHLLSAHDIFRVTPKSLLALFSWVWRTYTSEVSQILGGRGKMPGRDSGQISYIPI